MPEPPKPKPKGMQILGLPWWAWLAAVGGGLLVGFVFLRRKDNVPTMIGQSSPLDAASAGMRDENGAPADQLSSDVLAALGYLAEGQATLGDTLAQILAGGGNTVVQAADRGYAEPAPVLTSSVPTPMGATPIATQLSQLNPSGTSWFAPVPGSASAASLAATPIFPGLTPQAAASAAQGIQQFVTPPPPPQVNPPGQRGGGTLTGTTPI